MVAGVNGFQLHLSVLLTAELFANCSSQSNYYTKIFAFKVSSRLVDLLAIFIDKSHLYICMRQQEVSNQYTGVQHALFVCG